MDWRKCICEGRKKKNVGLRLGELTKHTAKARREKKWRGKRRRRQTNTNVDSSNDILSENLFCFPYPKKVLETPGHEATQRMIYKHNKAEHYVAVLPQIVMSRDVTFVLVAIQLSLTLALSKTLLCFIEVSHERSVVYFLVLSTSACTSSERRITQRERERREKTHLKMCTYLRCGIIRKSSEIGK